MAVGKDPDDSANAIFDKQLNSKTQIRNASNTMWWVFHKRCNLSFVKFLVGFKVVICVDINMSLRGQ